MQSRLTNCTRTVYSLCLNDRRKHVEEPFFLMAKQTGTSIQSECCMLNLTYGRGENIISSVILSHLLCNLFQKYPIVANLIGNSGEVCHYKQLGLNTSLLFKTLHEDIGPLLFFVRQPAKNAHFDIQACVE